MSGKGTLDERYFDWLYSQVASVKNRNPSRSHWLLCEQLFKKPFEYFVHNDHNRAEDGKELREEFLDEFDLQADQSWMELDCSMFELLIGLARRASFETNMTSDSWFWEMLSNLNLVRFNDEVYDEYSDKQVNLKLNDIVRRTYKPDGRGGLFPLKDSGKDQRKVEIWYQMSAYLLENSLIA